MSQPEIDDVEVLSKCNTKKLFRYLCNYKYEYGSEINLRESNILEFKEGFWTNVHQIGKYACAYFNSLYGGIIMFGIKDNCEIVGSPCTNEELNDKVELKIRNMVQSTVYPHNYMFIGHHTQVKCVPIILQNNNNDDNSSSDIDDNDNNPPSDIDNNYDNPPSDIDNNDDNPPSDIDDNDNDNLSCDNINNEYNGYDGYDGYNSDDESDSINRAILRKKKYIIIVRFKGLQQGKTVYQYHNKVYIKNGNCVSSVDSEKVLILREEKDKYITLESRYSRMFTNVKRLLHKSEKEVEKLTTKNNELIIYRDNLKDEISKLNIKNSELKMKNYIMTWVIIIMIMFINIIFFLQ